MATAAQAAGGCGTGTAHGRVGRGTERQRRAVIHGGRGVACAILSGECETLSPPYNYSLVGFSVFFSGQYQKLTGACPGADSDEPSSCDWGCIGGVAGGCFVLVLVCTGWLSGAFAKTGCPPPSKKLSRVRSRHKTEDDSAALNENRAWGHWARPLHPL